MSSPKAATKSRRPATNSKPKAAAKFAPAEPKLVPQNEHDSGMALCMYISIISTVPSKKCSILHCVGRALL